MTESQLYAECIYNAFALIMTVKHIEIIRNFFIIANARGACSKLAESRMYSLTRKPDLDNANVGTC